MTSVNISFFSKGALSLKKTTSAALITILKLESGEKEGGGMGLGSEWAKGDIEIKEEEEKEEKYVLWVDAQLENLVSHAFDVNDCFKKNIL